MCLATDSNLEIQFEHKLKKLFKINVLKHSQYLCIAFMNIQIQIICFCSFKFQYINLIFIKCHKVAAEQEEIRNTAKLTQDVFIQSFLSYSTISHCLQKNQDCQEQLTFHHISTQRSIERNLIRRWSQFHDQNLWQKGKTKH